VGTLLFIVILSCLGVILAWYIENEKSGAQGELGILAIKPNLQLTHESGRSYRVKVARTGQRQDGHFIENVPQSAPETRRFRAVSDRKMRTYRSGTPSVQYKKADRVQPKRPAAS